MEAIPKIIERKRNSFSFETLNNDRFFYENLLGSIHFLDEEGSSLKEKIDCLDTGRRDFKFKEDTINNRLRNLNTLVFNCTENCNLNCGYCIYSGQYSSERRHNSKNKMSQRIAQKALTEFMSSTIENPHVMFYGGEPLLEINFIKEAVAYAKSLTNREISFGMTTNFTLAKPYLDFLAKNNFLLSISLDGPLQTHDEWRKDRKGNGSFNRIINNLRIIADRFPEYFEKRIALSVTLTDPTKLIELNEFFSNTELLSILPINSQAIERNFLQSKELKANFSPEKMTEAESQYWQLAREYCNNLLNSNEPSHFEKSLFDMPLYQIYSRNTGKLRESIIPQGMCIPGARKLFVSCSGDYHMCEKMGDRLKLGSVEEGLNTSLIKKSLSKYYKIRNSVCQDCWAYKECLSCAASAKAVTNISTKGQMQNCERLEQMVFTGLSLYTHLLKHEKAEEKIISYFKDYETVEVKNG